MKTKEENTMSTELTTEQAKKLLNAIFNSTESELEDDNYPETVVDKVGYSEYVLTHTLQYIGKAIHRLCRLHHLLKLPELPDIITNNELRMALEPLLQVENDVKDIAEMLMEIYRETKPTKEVRND